MLWYSLPPRRQYFQARLHCALRVPILPQKRKNSRGFAIVQAQLPHTTCQAHRVSLVAAGCGSAGYPGGLPVPASRSRISVSCSSELPSLLPSYGGGASPSSFSPSCDRVAPHGVHRLLLPFPGRSRCRCLPARDAAWSCGQRPPFRATRRRRLTSIMAMKLPMRTTTIGKTMKAEGWSVKDHSNVSSDIVTTVWVFPPYF